MTGGNVTELKITPQTYIDMNQEFIDDDIPFRIAIPTQEAIDEWQNATPIPQPVRHTVDMVAEMWEKENQRLARNKMLDNLCVVYSDGTQECERICSLLSHIDVKFHEYRLNEHFTQRAFDQEFGAGATYPQVAIGAKHIGNLKEALQYMDKKGMFV